MERIDFREWLLDVDPELTRAAHRVAGRIGPDACTCVDCRNFVAARDAGLVYPLEMRNLFSQIGLDTPSETELAPICRENDGRHLVSGWLHVVGRVLGGPPVLTEAGLNASQIRTVPIEGAFELAFREDGALAPEPLRLHPLIQIEFLTRIPWILAEPDPEASITVPVV